MHVSLLFFNHTSVYTYWSLSHSSRLTCSFWIKQVYIPFLPESYKSGYLLLLSYSCMFNCSSLIIPVCIPTDPVSYSMYTCSFLVIHVSIPALPKLNTYVYLLWVLQVCNPALPESYNNYLRSLSPTFMYSCIFAVTESYHYVLFSSHTSMHTCSSWVIQVHICLTPLFESNRYAYLFLQSHTSTCMLTSPTLVIEVCKAALSKSYNDDVFFLSQTKIYTYSFWVIQVRKPA